MLAVRRRPAGRAATPILSLIGLSGGLAQRPGIGPVAHEDGVAGLEDAARLLLAVVQHAFGRDRADPVVAAQVSAVGGLRVVDGDLAVGVDDRAAAEAVDPFERVAGQALIGLALEDEAPHPVVAGARAPWPAARWRSSVSSCQVCGRLLAVLLQQVLAVVEHAGIGEPRHRDQLAADRVVLDDRLEVLV